jgi:hypothetical protein
MSDITSSILIVVIIIVLTMGVLIGQNRVVEARLMNGLWRASSDFCATSQLLAFMINLGDYDIVSGKRPGFLLMVNEEGILLNNPVDIYFSRNVNLNPTMCNQKIYDITIDWLGEDEPDFFPSNQTLTYYPTNGKMVLSVDDQVNAILYKDHESDASKRQMPESVSSGLQSEEI